MSWLDPIQKFFVRAPKPKALTGARVVPDLSLWGQFQRVGGGLTPQQVSNIIRQADIGEMSALVDLANDARQKDGHLQAILSQSEESIGGLDWELSLADSSKRVERKASEFVENILRGNASFHRMLAHHAGAVYYGYAVSEIVWHKVDGKLVPVCFDALSPRRFAFRAQDGCFVWRDEGMPRDGIDIVSDYPGKFIVSRPRITGDVPCREGLARVLMWASLFRNWTLSDWLRLGEIAWKPWRVGSYSKKDFATKEDVDGLVNVLDGMSTNGIAVIPDTVKLDVSWAGNPGAKSSTHAELFGIIAQEMSKAVLGQTETVQASRSSGYAQAKVHDAVRRDLLEARAKSIAFDISRDIIAPLVAMNFGPAVRPPVLQFVTQDSRDFVQFSSGVKTLTETGLKIPVSWIYDEAGIPVPTDADEVLGESDDEEADAIAQQIPIIDATDEEQDAATAEDVGSAVEGA